MARMIFTLAILCSAAALFLMQPLAGKILLPLLGGSPAVWNTCLVFFQTALLAGYCYADVLARRLPIRGQVAVHAAMLACAAAFLPIATLPRPPDGPPIPWLLGTLAVTVGPPFFALSATAPLLQRWFSVTRDRKAHDPYFLYAARKRGLNDERVSEQAA
ncbi:spermidine synthase, partial [bacterium]|nr:spermidine synthase [bacterium]